VLAVLPRQGDGLVGAASGLVHVAREQASLPEHPDDERVAVRDIDARLLGIFDRSGEARRRSES